MNFLQLRVFTASAMVSSQQRMQLLAAPDSRGGSLSGTIRSDTFAGASPASVTARSATGGNDIFSSFGIFQASAMVSARCSTSQRFLGLHRARLIAGHATNDNLTARRVYRRGASAARPVSTRSLVRACCVQPLCDNGANETIVAVDLALRCISIGRQRWIGRTRPACHLGVIADAPAVRTTLRVRAFLRIFGW